uniref:Uncharacterized protein n=1 Tax=Anguilla anguilla TaxID=7936 RepID=A0A0E9RQW8_ANGAN
MDIIFVRYVSLHIDVSQRWQFTCAYLGGGLSSRITQNHTNRHKQTQVYSHSLVRTHTHTTRQYLCKFCPTECGTCM